MDILSPDMFECNIFDYEKVRGDRKECNGLWWGEAVGNKKFNLIIILKYFIKRQIHPMDKLNQGHGK